MRRLTLFLSIYNIYKVISYNPRFGFQWYMSTIINIIFRQTFKRRIKRKREKYIFLFSLLRLSFTIYAISKYKKKTHNIQTKWRNINVNIILFNLSMCIFFCLFLSSFPFFLLYFWKINCNYRCDTVGSLNA